MAESVLGADNSFAAAAGMPTSGANFDPSIPMGNNSVDLGAPTVGLTGDRVGGLWKDLIVQLLEMGEKPAPQMQQINSSGALAGLKNYADVAKTQQGKIQTAGAASNAAGEQVIEATQEQANANQEKILMDQKRAQEVANIAQRFSEMFGVATNSEMIADKAAELAKMKDKIQLHRQGIRALQGVSLLDDPIAWIRAQIELPDRIKQHNTFAAEINGVEANINNAISASAAATTMASATVPQITKFQAAAAAKKEAADAKIKEGLTRQAIAQSNIDIATRETAAAAGVSQAEVLQYNIKVQEA
jgi:hypothetical protein